MSINKEPIKNQKNILTNELKKELNLLPKKLREKKNELGIISRENILLKEKSIFMNKELEKVSFNIMSLEKDLSLLLIKNDNIKSQQKILLNSINNEIVHNFYNTFLKNDKKLRDLMLIFFNFEDGFGEQLTRILDNDNELTTLLIGSYSYLKMLQNDVNQKYQQIKNKINNALNDIRDTYNKTSFCLIINYIENIFKLLDNKEKITSFEKQNKSLTNKKNEIFIKLKIIEESKKEKENNINTLDNYVSELLTLIEKYKSFSRYSKTKLINNIKNNKDININTNKSENTSGNNLNISCPNNPCLKKSNKISFNNETRNTNKVSYINIDLANIVIEKDKINNKKTIDSIDDINNKINNSNSIIKRINISNYNNINDLERDIFEHFEDLKTHPLYSAKITNKINNNSKNNNNIISKNKIKKKKNNKNIDNKKKKTSSNKSNNKNIINKNNNNDNKISQTNTNMTYNNNIIINNSNEINKYDISYDYSNQNIKINHYISTNYIKKNSPNSKQDKKVPQNKINKPGKMKLIPYLTQDYQINKDNQRKTNDTNIRRKTSNKESKNILNTKSPINSPNKTKKKININNNINNRIITSPVYNNLDTEQLTDKVNQSSYSKISQKNIYISIKHNKTNLCRDNLIEKNNDNEKRNRNSLNKIKVNTSKKQITKVNNVSRIERKNSPYKQSPSFFQNILNCDDSNNKTNINNKSKVKEITKINIDLEKCKNKSPLFKQRQYYDKFNKREICTDKNNNDKNENKNKDKDKDNPDISNINMNNSMNNKIMNNNLNNNNKNCHIIPFKKYKTNRSNINYIIDKKNNSKNIKNNKGSKNNNISHNDKSDKNKEKINISDINYNNNSQIVNSLVKKEINNYSFNKQDYKNHKSSYIKI